jgi:nitroreductase
VPTEWPADPTAADASADTQAVARALTAAATAAGYAPSIHNTQPWRWRLAGDTLDLYAEHSRSLQTTDPDTRLATLSCGAALHHARVVLAAQGWHAAVARMPNPAHPDHLARLRVDGPAPVGPRAVRRAQTILLRHTDRRPVAANPVGPDQLAAITTAVEAEGAWLHILGADQILDLAAAADHAQRTEAADPAWQAELGYWSGGTRPIGTGIPDSAIPARSPRTTVPGRDFGHHGDLPTSLAHDQAAVFAILYGRDDNPLDWLRAGEALSAGWLTATELGVSVLPLSATIEVGGTRQAMRALLASIGRPYLVLRFGTVEGTERGAPHAPRLPADQIIERPPL